MTCELCGLCELSSLCMNYVDLMLYGILVMHYLSTCDPCWASMNCYMLCMMCKLYFCLKKCGRKEKIVSRPYWRDSHDGRVIPGDATTLSHWSQWRDKAIMLGAVAQRGGTPRQNQTRYEGSLA
jgi:hypothetical protein